jgi:ketosteroid isomerase-like protein
MDAETRARRLEDIEQIRRLTAAYKQALDGKDVVAYAELFAKAGTLWCTPELQATGRAAIRALVDGMSGNLLTNEVGSDFHATANALIEVDGDRGTGTSTWLYFTVGADGDPRLTKIGHYDDHYIREDGCWRFHRRDAITDIPFV